MRHVARDYDGSTGKPVSEPVFLILTSLAVGPRHGYALMQDIEQISGGRVRLSTGTLYGAIRRLLDDGLIARFPQPDTSRDKQAYKLTGDGLRLLDAEVGRMRQLARIAASRIKESEA